MFDCEECTNFLVRLAPGSGVGSSEQIEGEAECKNARMGDEGRDAEDEMLGLVSDDRARTCGRSSERRIWIESRGRPRRHDVT